MRGKNFRFLTFAFCLITACQDEGAGKVSYEHTANAVCPAPQPISYKVAAEFNNYASNPLMQQFYKHYLSQQRELVAFQAHSPQVLNCPSAFWVENSVAAEFANLPPGDPMREFFKTYAAQQRALDAYYTLGR